MKTTISKFETKFLELIPEFIQPNILYISEEHGHVSWLCPCGCEELTGIHIKPFWDNGWDYTRNGDIVSFSPSIQFFGKCKSHYYITENEVKWC